MVHTNTNLGSEWLEDEIGEDACRKLDEKKSLFIILSTISLTAIILLTCFILFMIKPRLLEIGEGLYSGIVFTSITISIFAVSYHLLLIGTAISEKRLIPFFIKNSKILFALLYISQKLGNLAGISKDRLGNSFVKFNNSLVKVKKSRKIDECKLLILLPRCIQHIDCRQDVINNISNCKECGKCLIADLKALRQKYHFHILVATGGSLARQVIKKLRPELVFAVACERELMSGIQDTVNISVIGVPNERDEGPCRNTKTDIRELEKIIVSFIEGDNSKNGQSKYTHPETKTSLNHTKVRS